MAGWGLVVSALTVTDHVAQDPAAILLERGLARLSRRARRWSALAADGWGRIGRDGARAVLDAVFLGRRGRLRSTGT